MRSRNAVAAALLVLFGLSCSTNILPDPENKAASLPEKADVAVGATHDVLVVACQDRVTLTDIVFPVAATALFVGLGRLDAAFYLPDALVESVIPECKGTEYSVSGAAVEGTAFELEATQNTRAYKLHAKTEGQSTFHAQAAIGGENIDVSSTFTAWRADRVELAPRCDQVADKSSQLQGHVPAGRAALFTHKLYSGTRQLSGYGYFGLSHPRMTLESQGREVVARFTSEKGPFTVTSDIDPAFSLQLTTYDGSDYDSLVLERVGGEHLFAGATIRVRAVATIGGKSPCLDSFLRTLTIETPSICRFRNPDGPKKYDTRNAPHDLEALAPGTCTMTASIDGSSLRASLSIQVFRTFEATALPDPAVHPAIALTDLFVENADNYWLVGWKSDVSGFLESVTLRRTNGAWGSLQTKRPPRTLQAVHGVAGSLFAVGNEGQGARWTGSAWSAFDAGTGEDLSDVWVNSSNDVYAVGKRGTLVRFDGAQWSSLDAGVTTDLRSVWGDGAGNTYVAGFYGVVKRWNGAAFTDVLPAGLVDGGFHPNFVAGSGPSDLWIVSARDALHYDGQGWAFHPSGADAGAVFTKLWPVGDGYCYAIVNRGGSTYVERSNGVKTVSIPMPEGAKAITGVGNDIFVLTKMSVMRYRHDPADVFP